MFDLFPQASAESLAIAGQTPWQETATLGSMASAMWNEAVGWGNAGTTKRAGDDIANQEIDKFETLSGESIGPFAASPYTAGDAKYATPYGYTRQRIDAWNQQHPEQAFEFPTQDQLAERVTASMRAARLGAQAEAAKPQTFASTVGGYIGGLAGSSLDPINATSMAFGEGLAAGVVKTALVQFGIGVASQGLVAATTYGARHAADPDYTPRDAAWEALEGGAGNAVIGGGIKALAKGWRFLRDRGAPISQEVLDAGHVVERAGFTETANPFDDPHGEVVHRAGVDAAERALDQGEPFQMPPELAERFEQPAPITPSIEGVSDRPTMTVPEPEAPRIATREASTGRPVPLLEAIAGMGGIRRDADSARLGITNTYIPGRGNVVARRGKGVPIDEVRERLVLAGYPIGEHAAEDRLGSSTVDDLLQAIDTDQRARATNDQRLHSEQDGQAVAAWSDRETLGHASDMLDAFRQDARNEGLDVGDDALSQRAAAHYWSEGGQIHPGDAMERAAVELENELPEARAMHGEEALPGWSNDASSRAPEGGGAVPQARGPGEEGGAGARGRSPDAGGETGSPGPSGGTSIPGPSATADARAILSERVTPAAAERDLNSPEVHAAIMHDLEHLMAANPGLTITHRITDAAGNEVPVQRPLSDVLSDLVRDEQQAHAIGECLVEMGAPF